jgi:signal transduction histidine kinase
MKLESIREKEIAIVVIVSISIVSLVTLFYSTYDVQSEIRGSLFDQQRDRQLTQIQAIANNIQSDSELVFSHLRGLANSFYLQNGDLSGNDTENLLKETYAEISDIGDRLFVIDNKNIVRLNIVPEGHDPFIGTDMSSIQWVIDARSNLAPTFSKGVVGLDGSHRIFMTYPIINRQDGSYMGLVGVAIPTIQFFEKYASVNNIQSQFLVAYDREGNYIATPRTELMGKNFFSEEVQKVFNYNSGQNELYQQVFSEGQPSYAVYDFGGGERLNTGYPVFVNGQPAYFIFVVIPTDTIYSQIEAILSRQQTDLLMQRAISIAAIAAVAFFIIRLNSKLKKKVKEKTKSLEESNENLVRANEQLQSQDKMQREFINVAAHELRTPIVPILGFSEVLYSKAKELRQKEHKQEKVEQLQEQEEMLEIILRNADRLHQLTEDILDVTRIESQTLKLRKERFNLNDLMVEVIEDSRKRIANGNVKLMYELGNNSTVIVEADRRRLTQVISNLLDNAIKFTKEGNVTVTTTTITQKKETDNNDNRRGGGGGAKEGPAAEEELVVIAIKDTGSGIDHELLPRLFTKFATKSYRGTGLGLYISRSIIEAHGGKIWACNNNNNNNSSNNNNENEKLSDSDGQLKGATFYFTLPFVSETDLTAKEKREAKLINDQQPER